MNICVPTAARREHVLNGLTVKKRRILPWCARHRVAHAPWRAVPCLTFTMPCSAMQGEKSTGIGTRVVTGIDPVCCSRQEARNRGRRSGSLKGLVMRFARIHCDRHVAPRVGMRAEHLRKQHVGGRKLAEAHSNHRACASCPYACGAALVDTWPSAVANRREEGLPPFHSCVTVLFFEAP